MRGVCRLLLLLGLMPLPGHALDSYKVVNVYDGDTLVLANGDKVRLVDIDAPEGPHHGADAEPFADASRALLRHLVDGKEVRLESGRKARDQYGRRLAHVYVGDVWVNGRMVEQGLAVAYTFADNHMRADEILAREHAARQAKLGLWAHPRWQVKDTATCCASEEMGLFQVVEGKVLASGRDKEHMYLNFGPDYRSDFTVRIAFRDKKHFAEEGIQQPDTYYVGKTVRVHGHVRPVYGAMVVVSHPAQIEVVGGR